MSASNKPKDWVSANRQLVEALSADQRENFEERAAIMEYCGGLTRYEAEKRAYIEALKRKKYYK